MQPEIRRLMLDPGLVPFDKQNLISKIASKAESMAMPSYMVGGFVRDLLLRKPVNDYDVVFEGDAIRLGKGLAGEFGGRLTVHGKFQTAVWLTNDHESIDLITARSESYFQPGALPTVKPSTILEDLRRRDFSINAMAIRLDGRHFGEFLDISSGREDLEHGQVRVLHPRSFIEDPTRIFRAVRYEQRYGFKLELHTVQLINGESLKILSLLSGERLRHEFDMAFLEDKAGDILARLSDLGVLAAIHPGLPGIESRNVILSNLKPAYSLGIIPNPVLVGWLSWLKSLPEESILSISQRLDFNSVLREDLLYMSRLLRNSSALSGSKPSAWTMYLDGFSPICVYVVWLITNESALREYLIHWRHVKPHIRGDYLKERGIPPGPAYKTILTRLRAAWLDGEVHNEQEEESLFKSLL